jgi:hypothetical protein
MSRIKRPWLKILLLAGFLLFLQSQKVEGQSERFYDGKAVRIIVGSTPGGFCDRWARLLARYIPKYIAGNPTFSCKTCRAPVPWWRPIMFITWLKPTA